MGSFICTCPEGYDLSPITQICEDIDECAINPGICENGQCVNTDGGAFCTCPDGFILEQNSMKCVDVRYDIFDIFSYMYLTTYISDKISATIHLQKANVPIQEECKSRPRSVAAPKEQHGEGTASDVH